MSSNSTVLVDREIAAGMIEGVDFGPKLWVIARSPHAVLVWVFGQSWSLNGHKRYSEPHLVLLPDRTKAFTYRPNYKRLEISGMTRLHADKILPRWNEIEPVFPGSFTLLTGAIRQRRTLLIDGGGGQLQPLGLYGKDYENWRARGGGFVMRPEGDRR